MASETFKWNWRGWARSSEGFGVRLLGRTNLQYTDEYGDLRISAEAMRRPSTEVVVYTATIPDRPERSQEEILLRLRRAFDYKGWTMVEEAGRNARSWPG
ncbi:hypothetical protein [Nocardioides mangrovi]|uniref:Uncharacterized protein n=1 Tax=Nocardioides mangrovi TaxID=2874580 RepID=A0ABS7U876_9ACTN|nr:hypothetical protein [Nocardioides mangrovi]MBZ5736918.1 hypothetical protein [Nocardioides mangrovi]